MNAFAVNDALRVKQVTDQVALRELLEAAALINLSKQPVVPRIVIGTAIQATAHAVSPPGVNCGGTDYPPCYVAQRESGNQYDAYNPTGCGGNGCFGRWQFSGAWAGKLGLPSDLRSATPAQQDEAARLLWNHGAGCSNWAAC